MNRQRLFLGGLLSLVAGLGLWTVAAVTFQGVSGTFVDGEVLTAQDLNTLFDAIDANFGAAKVQIDANEIGIAMNASSIADNTAAIALNSTAIEAHTVEIAANTANIATHTAAIGTNATSIQANEDAIAVHTIDIAALQSDKVAKAGDSMSGELSIVGDTGAMPSSRDVRETAALYVQNTNTSGVSAFIQAGSDQPALYVKNLGSGALIKATNGSDTSGLIVANNGSLAIGTTGSPEITLDAATGDITLAGDIHLAGDINVAGTIRNSVGDPMSPVAWASYYGNYNGDGYVAQKSQNISGITSDSVGHYRIQFSGVDITVNPVVSLSMWNSGLDSSITYLPDSQNDAIWVYVYGNGVATFYPWSFILMRP